MQEKVEHVMQFVSVDGFGKRAEYVRHGLDFNYMMDNVEEFLERIPAQEQYNVHLHLQQSKHH